MSAFICGDAHISYLVSAGLDFARRDRCEMNWYSHGTAENPPRNLGKLTRDNASEVGSMLLRANYTSVNARYSEQSIGGAYVHVPTKTKIDPVQVLKALSCYEYQSCEASSWYESEARAFCEALRSIAISRLPGYEAAAWEVA